MVFSHCSEFLKSYFIKRGNHLLRSFLWISIKRLWEWKGTINFKSTFKLFIQDHFSNQLPSPSQTKLHEYKKENQDNFELIFMLGSFIFAFESWEHISYFFFDNLKDLLLCATFNENNFVATLLHIQWWNKNHLKTAYK